MVSLLITSELSCSGVCFFSFWKFPVFCSSFSAFPPKILAVILPVLSQNRKPSFLFSNFVFTILYFNHTFYISYIFITIVRVYFYFTFLSYLLQYHSPLRYLQYHYEGNHFLSHFIVYILV